MNAHRYKLAKVYTKFLSNIDWSDKLLLGGLKEGRNKFLSNAHLSLFSGMNKYAKSHFVSPAALEIMQREVPTKWKNLTFEHMVPKDSYIQKECEKHAMEGSLTEDLVFDLLERFWHMATITKADEKKLNDMGLRKAMPQNWDRENFRARYDIAEVDLIKNPFFVIQSAK